LEYQEMISYQISENNKNFKKYQIQVSIFNIWNCCKKKKKTLIFGRSGNDKLQHWFFLKMTIVQFFLILDPFLFLFRQNNILVKCFKLKECFEDYYLSSFLWHKCCPYLLFGGCILEIYFFVQNMTYEGIDL
jgi:hypothetical protein